MRNSRRNYFANISTPTTRITLMNDDPYNYLALSSGPMIDGARYYEKFERTELYMIICRQLVMKMQGLITMIIVIPKK